MRALITPTVALILATFAAACAGPSLCERKARYFDTRCRGQSSVTGSVPLDCEANLERCTPGQKAQMEGYVSCLESAGVCSLDVMRRCQEAFPGGVNLRCS